MKIYMKECSKTTAIESMPLFLSPRKLAISSVSSISCSTIICKVDLKNKFQDFYPSFSFLLHSNFLRNLSSKYFFFKFSLDLQTKYYHISHVWNFKNHVYDNRLPWKHENVGKYFERLVISRLDFNVSKKTTEEAEGNLECIKLDLKLKSKNPFFWF